MNEFQYKTSCGALKVFFSIRKRKDVSKKWSEYVFGSRVRSSGCALRCHLTQKHTQITFLQLSTLKTRREGCG